MIITKVLETSVDLFDSKDIYTSNIIDMLIKKLTDRYRNKCFQSMLITEIVKIIRHSDIKMVDNRLDGGAYINVQFEAKGIILVRGEILNGCKVIEILDTGIIIEHEFVGGLIVPGSKQQIFNVIKKGQYIPVIINEVRYNPGQREISIYGSPFVPQMQTNTYYSISSGINDVDADKLNKMLEDLNTELKLHDNMTKERSYEFFKSLLYPFKTQQKFEISKLGSKFSVVSSDEKSLLDIDSGCMVSPLESQNTNNFIYHSKQVPKETNGIIVSAGLYTAVSDILNRRLMYLMSLRNFATYYNTKEKTQEMLVYWQVCQSTKE
jgi:DNA-directed RNA polymerase subunit E'/Rpb7